MYPNQVPPAPPPTYDAATNPYLQQQPPIINQQPQINQPEERVIAKFEIDIDKGQCSMKAPKVKEMPFFPSSVSNLGPEVEESIKTLIEKINDELKSRNLPKGPLAAVCIGGPFCLLFSSISLCPFNSPLSSTGMFLVPVAGVVSVAGANCYCQSKLKGGLESLVTEWNSQYSFMGVYLRWNNSMIQYLGNDGSRMAMLRLAMARSAGQEPGLEVVINIPAHYRYCQEKGIAFNQP